MLRLRRDAAKCFRECIDEVATSPPVLTDAAQRLPIIVTVPRRSSHPAERATDPGCFLVTSRYPATNDATPASRHRASSTMTSHWAIEHLGRQQTKNKTIQSCTNNSCKYTLHHSALIHVLFVTAATTCLKAVVTSSPALPSSCPCIGDRQVTSSRAGDGSWLLPSN